MKKKKLLPSQSKPFPEYPLLQAHEKLPWVFMQSELISHPPLFVEHSLISNSFISLVHCWFCERKKKENFYHCK